MRIIDSAPMPVFVPVFLQGSGELGRLIAAFDWSATALGPISGWPHCLRAAVSMILRAPTAMALLWGEDGLMLYNAGYAAIAGQRHPAILGGRAEDAFPELAAFNRHVIATCLGGDVLSFRDRRMVLTRGSAAEEVWLDLNYSPVTDESGRPAGVLAVVVDTTARNLADERLRIAQEAGRFGAFEWFPDQGLVVVSDAYRQIFGLPEGQEVTHRALLELVLPEDRKVTGIGRVGQVANPLAYSEYRIRHGVTGEMRWIARRGEIRQGGGAAVRCLGVAWDITERKQAELQDAFVAELGRQLQDVGDPVQVIAIASRMLATYLGVGRVGYGEMNEAGTHLVISHGWGDGTMPPFAGAFRIDEFGGRNLRIVRAGGVLREADVYSAPELSAPEVVAGHKRIGMRAALAVPLMRDGSFAGVLFAHCAHVRHWEDGDEAVMHAVIARTWEAVQRARAEQRLRESEETFRLFAQAMPNQVWAATPDGQVNWFNDRVYAYCGVTPGSLDGALWLGFLHPEDRDTARAAWTTAVQAGTTYEIEFRIRRADGAYRWHIARALPIVGEDGAVRRWIGTSTDIEEQRRILADLARLNATLEERVAERTRELRQTEEALRQSQKMEAIGQLTGGIAHDFNNLLTGIQGALELVRRRIAVGRTGDLDRFMDAAMASSQRAASLTQRLLAFARRQSLDTRPVAVGALVHGMAELLGRTLGEQVSLDIRVPAETWHAMTDPNQLENAILNLAINARDAMPQGGQLIIETENISLGRPDLAVEPGDYVAISVTDTGSGMPQAVLEKVFEPFFTTKPVGQGTGLGLSMVYGFIRQCGGDVRITSAPGSGTRVRLILQRAPAAASVTPPDAPDVPSGAGETVLVVEDDPAVRMLVVAVLQELGYRTMEASDGPSALPVLAGGGAIDLLVSDVGLPGLNGRQVADYARERRPELKVLFLTGYAEQAASRSGFLAPGMAMITKPFAIETLAAKLSEMMAGAAASSEPSE